jgi:hypothetical protein
MNTILGNNKSKNILQSHQNSQQCSKVTIRPQVPKSSSQEINLITFDEKQREQENINALYFSSQLNYLTVQNEQDKIKKILKEKE